MEKTIILLLVVLNIGTPKSKDVSKQTVKEVLVSLEPYKITTRLDSTEIKVVNYMKRYFPNSPLTGELITKYSRKYKICPAFIIAVGRVETNMGTDPKAYRCQRNKTIFSVGEYDDGTSVYSNKTWEEGLDRFCRLINSYYLVKKTEEELLKKFVNIHGQRYASAPEYEKVVYEIYKQVKGSI